MTSLTASDNPLPIRLVTFAVTPAAMRQAASNRMASIADQCLVFENHYVQTEGWCDFHSGSGPKSITALLDEYPKICKAAEFSTGKESLGTKSPWSKSITVNTNDEPHLRQCISGFLTESPHTIFTWLHFDIPQDTSPASVATILETSITEDAFTIITAADGTHNEAPSGLHSLAFNDKICIPLWIALPMQDGCTIQTICGTSDILATITSRLTSSAASNEHTETSDSNLFALCEQPGISIERSVVIKLDRLEAVRTTHFLLVRTTNPETPAVPNDRTALYSKPHDVWNLHDVSNEYQAVLAELLQMLDDQ